MKNICIPSKQEYLMQLTHSVRKCVNNLRWRAEHFLRPKHSNKPKEKYGFKSLINAGPIAEMKEFEDKLYDLTRSIEFKEVPNSFKNKLNCDIRKINKDPRVNLPADKTKDFYKVRPADAEALIEKEIMKDYRKAEPDIVEQLRDAITEKKSVFFRTLSILP